MTLAQPLSSIGEPSLGGQPGLFIEGAGLIPQPRACRPDPVAPLRDSLVAHRDLLVPSFDQTIAFKPCHHLIKGWSAAPDPISRNCLPDRAPRLLPAKQGSKHQKLKMSDGRQLIPHNAALYAIQLSRSSEAPKSRVNRKSQSANDFRRARLEAGVV